MSRSATLASFALLLALAPNAAPQTAPNVMVTCIDVNGNAFVLSQGSIITLAPTSVGTPAAVTVDIANRGIQSVAVNWVGVSGAGFQLSGAPLPGTILAAGADLRFTVQFNPTQAGAASGSLNVIAGAQNFTFPLSALAVVPTSNIVVTYVNANGNAIVLAQGSIITFASATVGTPAIVTVDMANRGAQSAVVNSVGVSGAGFQLSGVPLPGTILAAGADLRFTVQFNPTQAGTVSGSLSVSAGTQNLSFPLSAQAVVPTSNVVATYVNANGNSVVLAQSSSITFASTTVGTPAVVTVDIANSGSQPVVVNSVGVAGAGFQLSGAPFPGTTIAVGADLHFTVQFNPTQIGTASGSLSVSAGTQNFSFPLSAQAVGPTFTYQLQIGNNTAVLPSGQTITIPDTAVGATSSVTLIIQNTGNAAGAISSIIAVGTAFQLTNVPLLPLTVGPGASQTFSIAFTPTQAGPAAGRLAIGSDAFVLSSNGLGPALSFSYSVAGTDMPLSTNGTISFVPVAVGTTQSTTVKLLNTGTVQALIANVSVNGASGVFSVAGLPALPLKLNPGAGASLSVIFTPNNIGTATATLQVDANTFNLLGSATAPPALSSVTFVGAGGTVQPLAQPAVGLSLQSAYPLDLNGTLTLQFDSAEFSDDPSIQFSNGSRTIAFTIPANTTSALFPNNAQQVKLQTGSVAGDISLTASFTTSAGLALQPPSTPTLTLTVPQAAPRVTGVQVSSSSSTGFNLLITGLSTSRQVSQIGVQFTPVLGLALSIPSATLNVSESFATWYQTTTSQSFGSLFTVAIPFTLQGQVSGYANLIDALQSATVTVSSPQGSSAPQVISLH